MSPASFTSLPAEVRNAIYGFCTPFTGYMEEFKGLLLASKRIGAEYESEAVRVMVTCLESMKKTWPHMKELRFDRPERFRDLTSCTIFLPITLYYPSRATTEEQRVQNFRDNTRLEPCLAFLFSLHLSQLIFTCYDDRPNDWSGLSDLPTGLLYDLTNTLITPSALEHQHLGFRTQRKFRLSQPLRVKRLSYKWYQHKSSTGWDKLDVQTRHTRFFLSERMWHELPNSQTFVRNWGSSSRDEVFFDMENEA